MRYALVSDVHGNQAAWEAVDRHLKGNVPAQRLQPCDEVVLLGDLIGYGPDSAFCAALAVEREFRRWLNGNHERTWLALRECLRDEQIRYDPDQSVPGAFARLKELAQDPARYLEASDLYSGFAKFLNEYLSRHRSISVRTAAIVALLRFEAEQDTEEIRRHFADLCQKNTLNMLQVDDNGVEIRLMHEFHPTAEYVSPWNGSRIQGKEDLTYTDRLRPILEAYANHPGPLCLVFGHSHVPLYCAIDNPAGLDQVDMTHMQYGTPQRLGHWLTLINPGSLGYAADMDKRAAFAVIDTSASASDGGPSVTYYRVSYQVQKTTQKMVMAGSEEMEKLQRELTQSLPRVNGYPLEPIYAMLKKRSHSFGGL